MNWEQLLSDARWGSSHQSTAAPQKHRSNYDRDYGRILFSSAFRRLQDKTQVFPLGRNDYVRTRLTHSLEVAHVGSSLGMLVGEWLAGKDALPAHIIPSDLATIVSTACLAHDIGNPPFGHSGEDAIETANAIASEHLEIVTKNPFEVMTKIQNAGAIFMGEYLSLIHI